MAATVTEGNDTERRERALQALEVLGQLLASPIADDLSDTHAQMHVAQAVASAFNSILYFVTAAHPRTAVPGETVVQELAPSLDFAPHAAAGAAASAYLAQALAQSAQFITALSTNAECEITTPYKPMYLVRKPDGTMVWRCQHQPYHETPV